MEVGKTAEGMKIRYMSRRPDARDKALREGSDGRVCRVLCEPSHGPSCEESQQGAISPGLDPYVAFRMGLAMGRALTAQQQEPASTKARPATEGKEEQPTRAEPDRVARLQNPADQGSSTLTSNADRKWARAEKWNFSVNTSSLSQEEQQKLLDFRIGLTLLGEERAKRYLERMRLLQERRKMGEHQTGWELPACLILAQ